MNGDVSHRLPSKLSPSRAKNFIQCPRLFYYTTICGIATPPTEATIKGTLCHHVFERVFDHPRPERTLEVARSYVEPAWAAMTHPLKSLSELSEGTPEFAIRQANGLFREAVDHGSDHEKRLTLDAAKTRETIESGAGLTTLLEGAHQSVAGWFSMEDPTKFDPLERELYVSASVAGATVHGYIDRLDRTEGPDGSPLYWISDYKTGKPPAPRFQDEAFFQLEVYALLISETLGVTPHQLRLIYVREGRRDAILRRPVTDAVLKKTRMKLKTVWGSIQKAARTNTWEPKKQVLCNWCHFQDVCPEWNPHLEGLLPEEENLLLPS